MTRYGSRLVRNRTPKATAAGTRPTGIVPNSRPAVVGGAGHVGHVQLGQFHRGHERRARHHRDHGSGHRQLGGQLAHRHQGSVAAPLHDDQHHKHTQAQDEGRPEPQGRQGRGRDHRRGQEEQHRGDQGERAAAWSRGSSGSTGSNTGYPRYAATRASAPSRDDPHQRPPRPGARHHSADQWSERGRPEQPEIDDARGPRQSVTPNRVISGGSAEIIIRPVAPPWSTRPTRKSGTGASAASAEATTNVAAYPRKRGRCTCRWAS